MLIKKWYGRWHARAEFGIRITNLPIRVLGLLAYCKILFPDMVSWKVGLITVIVYVGFIWVLDKMNLRKDVEEANWKRDRILLERFDKLERMITPPRMAKLKGTGCKTEI